MKVAKDINGNKVLKINGFGFRGFSIQTLWNLPYTHKNGLHCIKTTKTEVFEYVANHGTKYQKQALQVGEKFSLRNMINEELNRRSFFKCELNENDIDQLMSIFGKGCKCETKRRLRSVFEFSGFKNLSRTWFLDRVIYTGSKWVYVARQDYSYEVSDIRKELLKCREKM